MKRNTRDIINEALALEPTTRAYLAEVLLESLDYEEDFVISDAWREEINKRCAVVDSGQGGLLDGDNVLQEIRSSMK